VGAYKATKNIYIIDGLRTPIGSTHKSLKKFSAAALASAILKEFVRRYPAVCQRADEVLLGNTVSAGTGQNVVRQAIIAAGLPAHIPGTAINSVCGSGLEAVILACRAILCGEAKIVFAGGTESASHSPKILHPDKDEPVESLICDGLWCMMSNKHMGQIAEDLARHYKVSSAAQNQFAYESHAKAVIAQEQKKFQAEIVPLTKEDGSLVCQDDRPRRNTSFEKMEKLPSAFEEEGTVTAGNASAPADGAAIVLLASEDALKLDPSLKPQARILAYASVALDPKKCFEAGVLAARDCLSVANLSVKDIDLFEVGESFAAQAVWTKDQLKVENNKMNIYGGDIALGHPLGSTSARLLVTLLHALKNENKKRGLAVICFGSGGATSMVIERL